MVQFVERFDELWTNVSPEGRKELKYHQGIHRRRWHEARKIGEKEMEIIRQELHLGGEDWRVSAAEHLQARFEAARDGQGKPFTIPGYFAFLIKQHTVRKTPQ